MEELSSIQSTIGKELEQLLTNMKKDSASRKNIEYCTKRIDTVSGLWKQFQANHAELMKFSETNSDHPYFTTMYHDKVVGLKHTIDAKLIEYVAQAAAAEQQNQPSTPAPAGSSAQDGPTTSAPPPGDLAPLIKSQKLRMQKISATIDDVLKQLQQKQSPSYYKLKKERLTLLEADLVAHDTRIWELTSLDRIADYSTHTCMEYELRIQNTIVALDEELLKTTQPSDCTQPLPSLDQIRPHQPHQATSIKLPEIKIPKFDGDYLKWTQFYELYTQLIHNTSISNTQKMFYLVNNLSGEAASLIKHLPISNDNYEDAWNILTSRYDNKRLLVHAIINRFLGQSTCQAESASSIKNLHDTTKECVLGLKNLGFNTESWDPLLVNLLCRKLDKDTHRQYEQSLESPRELQTLQHLLTFMENKFQSLEFLGGRSQSKSGARSSVVGATTAGDDGCVLCKSTHPLYRCKTFLDKSPSQRFHIVKRNELCPNCLRKGHKLDQCNSRSCTKCDQKHNTLLHVDEGQRTPNRQGSTSPSAVTATVTSSSSSTTTEDSGVVAAVQRSVSDGPYILLGTAVVKVTTSTGAELECRALLDSGSQFNLVTERLAKRLGVEKVRHRQNFQGVGDAPHQSQFRVHVTVKSRLTGFEANIEALVMSKITSSQPSTRLNIHDWKIPKNVKLADPEFYRPGSIDMLIGAEYHYGLLSIGQIKLSPELPLLQNTVLGWIVSGKVDHTNPETPGLCLTLTTAEETSLNQQVEKFWALEEFNSDAPTMTTAERKCEDHFNRTVRKDDAGRFIVKLPFRQPAHELGESKDIAFVRLRSIERKLQRNPELKTQYKEFMDEYLRLGHMEEANVAQISKPYYVIPHHCVLKPDSTTTKLRVVFDASAKTSTNTSLNELLHTGPRIQDELFSILLRFRMVRFVFTADIEKMYRQILVDKEDRKYQLIMWRNNDTEPVKYYQLRTVTYGVTTSPYLAIKCLQRLSEENQQQQPLGAAALRKDFYVDDVMTGSNSLQEAVAMQRELNSILQSAGFKLRKWCANHRALLDTIPMEDRAIQLDLCEMNDTQIKTLGLRWSPQADEFQIKIEPPSIDQKVTKRRVLSEVAQIFDPLGIMGPVVVTAKLFIQQLWQLKLDWDAAVPAELFTRWNQFRTGLQALGHLQIPRHVLLGQVTQSLQLHVFSDASERAFGAAVYIRAVLPNKSIIGLLCAKSRVAPTKKVNVPRLELAAALLAAQLAERVIKDLTWKHPVYFWTDSEIVLGWLNAESASYFTFVANRISAIQQLSNADQWRHVPTEHNPADLISRGVTPEKFPSCSQWFFGPMFLHAPESKWPVKTTICEPDLEKRGANQVLTAISTDNDFLNHIRHGNSFSRLQRIVAYVIRFARNVHDPDNQKRNIPLTTQELEAAMTVIVKHLQQQHFAEEYAHLQKHDAVNATSPLKSLSPFIDPQGLIRVGGRIHKADIPYDAKHQMLLPYGQPITKLLMKYLHESHAHCGPQALLAISRQRFWVVKGKTIARAIIQECVRCRRAKPQLLSQFMGNLPASRIEPARPFINSGVDFCGPFWIHYKIRGKRPTKCYVAIFCCFVTKAVHIEIVSDLSTDAFLGALKRFIGRRGHCKNIYCDNATNFCGANNKLQELQDSIFNNNSSQRIQQFCGMKYIEFHFIPPRSPHFGGLWEAAVKSAKQLLLKTTCPASLTYEELETVMIEVEAILNSRPLTPLSDDPNDLSPLTPGHFLIGEALTSTVDPHSQPPRGSLLHKWKMVSHIRNEFWQRWSRDYLSEMQHRYKWTKPQPNVTEGMMVILKEDNLPPLSWPLGRIVQVIKGPDDLVRVVDVKTATGTFRRPIHRLAPLPSTAPEDASPEDTTALKDTPSSSKRSSDEDRSSSPTSGPSRKRPRSTLSALGLVLLAGLVLPTSHADPFSVQPFASHPGLYFEDIGTAHLVSSEWNLVVYYDLNPYQKEWTTMLTGLKQLEQICNLVEDTQCCNNTIKQFRKNLKDTENSNALLAPPRRRRFKRAPLNIIGNIASSLFGVLDSDYAHKMSSIINSVENNEHHLLELLKNQTSIIDSTTNVMRSLKKDSDEQLEEFKHYLDQATETVNGLSQELQARRIMELFNTMSVDLMIMMNNYQRIQSALLDVMIDSHHGKISPKLLTPQQLQAQISTIKEHLPPTLRLPTGRGNLLEIYSLLTVESRRTDTELIFRLKLPLFNEETFNLMQVTAIPFPVNASYYRIKRSAPYLIVNLHRDLYYPLTTEEMNNCRLAKDNNYVCPQTHPLYRKGAQINTCEVVILTQPNVKPHCNIEEIIHVTHWIQLARPNHWLYVFKDAEVINIVCTETTAQRTLSGSGTITLTSGCLIRDEYTTIQGHNIYSTAARTAFIPSLNFTDWMPQLTEAPRLSTTAPHIKNSSSIFETLHQKIQELRTKEDSPLKIHEQPLTHFVISTSTLFITILIVAYLAKRFYMDRRRAATPPQFVLPRPVPAKRTRQEDFELKNIETTSLN